MIDQTHKQSGFTAAELLITLFIAAAFIITGYQLYGIIIKDSSSARQRAVASNAAYEVLRKYSPQATDPCSAGTASPAPTVPTEAGLSNASISAIFSCPHGTTSPISKLSVTLTYGSPQQEVSHAIYISG